VLVFAFCLINAGAIASAWAQQNPVNLGTGSFKVDPGAVIGTYQQSGQGITFGPRVSLGDGVGGTIPPIRVGAASGVGLIMRLIGTNPELPFTLETFDANFNVTAKFQGQTTGLGLVASFVPLKLVEGSVQGVAIAGLQFTWDGDGPINIELLSLSVSTSPSPGPTPAPKPTATPPPSSTPPRPAPTATPTPTPAPNPIASPPAKPGTGVAPQPARDRTRPGVKIVSPNKVRGSHYTLRANLSDNVRPLRVQYRLRAPGAKDFGKWIPVNLRNKAKTQNWSSPRLTLNRRGVWQVQVQAFDAAKNASLVPTLRVNRTH
jgi:hypothetical protein